MAVSTEITRRLVDAREGDEEALNDVFQRVYDVLRSIAHQHLVQDRYSETLNTTALVHETYERLIGSTNIDWQDRTHFFSIASRAMRYIIVDYARGRSAQKRGGKVRDVPLDAVQLMIEERSAELVALDEALRQLSSHDERLARLVELKFFGGLTYEEIAEISDQSVRTVRRDWQRARTWICWAVQSESP